VPRAPGEAADFYVGVRDALVTGEPPAVPAAEAVAVIEVLDAARRSAAENVVVRIEQPVLEPSDIEPPVT
jgi:predicted dehydrogenase